MTHSGHHHHSDAAAAAQAQHDATVIGWVAGTAIPRERLDARVRELRAGRFAGRLPAVGSKEDRQFLRWTAQVLLTEELCRVELARLQGESALGTTGESARGTTDISALGTTGEPALGATGEPALGTASESALGTTDADSVRALTQAESLHLGSINAAAWASTRAMSALYDLVTDATAPAAPHTDTRAWYRVTHVVAATPLEAATAAETSLGWTTLDDLPAPLAAELRALPPGTRVGPVRTGLGWHFATITDTEARPTDPAPRTDTIDPTRLAAFNRWLDERRRALVAHAPGFEHPGDPSQPDNTHRH